MDVSRPGFFQKIYYSVAGFNYYRYFIMQNTGQAVLHLLVLSLVLGVTGMAPGYFSGNRLIDGFISNFDKSVPDFTFENGKLDVKGNMPIKIGEGGYTIIIDTSGKTDETILDEYDTVILLTGDKMIQKTYANKQVTDFSIFSGLKINKGSVKAVLPLVKVFMAIGFIFGIIFLVCGRFLSALVVSLAGLIMNSVMNTNLPYRDIFKLSSYSLTLPLFVGLILDLASLNIPYIRPVTLFIFYALAVVYIWGAFKIIKRDKDTPAFPPEGTM